MKVSVKYAAEHFEDLLIAFDSGQVVEIDRPDKPAVQLVSSATPESLKPVAKRILGAGMAFSRLPTEQELERIDREWKHELEDGSILPLEQR